MDSVLSYNARQWEARAILDGRKTVTRRAIKPRSAKKAKANEYCQGNGLWIDPSVDNGDNEGHIKDYSISPCWIPLSYYIEKYAPCRPGDILYVRETWCRYGKLDNNDHVITGTKKYYYRADGENPTPYNDFLVQHPGWDEHRETPMWRPSIHMPKSAARIWLKVTDVRVERLQDITPGQCIAEGVEEEALEVGGEFVRGIFSDIWDSTIKKPDLARYGWEANPWVWVIEFERCENPSSDAT